MTDSKEQAQKDATLYDINYNPGEFRKFFTSPFQQYKLYVGQPFTVVKQIQEMSKDEENDDERDDMYLIQFEDGTQIEAFGHEVCTLNY